MMIVFALLLHLVFLASVFDIYFKSPVVPSSQLFAPDYVAPARRLVLFVADGLRADSLFSLSESETPYFRKIIRDFGAWGVSHTRVPTESRPGHVALIAGMFEDPSAITRGWRENPVDFDTLFNQSRYTWSWGSPDILPMFAKGATNDKNNQPRVFTEMYESSFEDFSSKDLSQLDSWVFDKVDNFFERAFNDSEMQLKLREDQLVLFLHLLGCDTNGHEHKPNSKELLHNIKVLDDRIKKIVDVMERYWRRDGRTSYIFTSDHGMTDWGSHGAGLDQETQTPLIAWGAGIRQPKKEVTKEHLIERWPLVEGSSRSDVNQTDVSVLMASLLGVNMPQNSMGKVPLDYLKLHQSHLVKAKFSNVMQSYHQFLSFQRQFVEAPMAWLFHAPFADLTEDIFKQMQAKIVRAEAAGRYKDALNLLEKFHEKSVEGLYYYQRYHRFSLYVATTLSYTGFVVYVAIILMKNYSTVTVSTDLRPDRKNLINTAMIFALVLATAITYAQNAPWHYNVYYYCPIFVAYFVARELLTLQLLPVSKVNCKKLFAFFALCLLITECLVVAFFDRRLLSVAIVFVCVYQSWICRHQDKVVRLLWICLCIFLCTFTFMPTVGKEANPNLVVVSGLLSATFAIFLYVTLLLPLKESPERISSGPFYLGIFYLVLSSLCIWASSLYDQGSIKFWSQTVAWFIMVTSLTVALLTEPLLLPRLLALSLGLQSMYILLSLSYEVLFLLCMVSLLFTWLILEHRKCFAYQSWIAVPMSEIRERRVLVIDDIWRALLFLFFSVVSFFGTGNLASINSFDPKSIRSLVSVFNPFLMGGLLLLKVLIPFLVVACFLCAVKQVSQMPSRALFLLLLLFSDLMGLHFFFLVTDRGSWLEIGTSLSHFVIAEATVIFLQLFYMLAKYLMQIKCLVGRNNTKSDHKR